MGSHFGRLAKQGLQWLKNRYAVYERILGKRAGYFFPSSVRQQFLISFIIAGLQKEEERVCQTASQSSFYRLISLNLKLQVFFLDNWGKFIWPLLVTLTSFNDRASIPLCSEKSGKKNDLRLRSEQRKVTLSKPFFLVVPGWPPFISATKVLQLTQQLFETKIDFWPFAKLCHKSQKEWKDSFFLRLIFWNRLAISSLRASEICGRQCGILKPGAKLVCRNVFNRHHYSV